MYLHKFISICMYTYVYTHIRQYELVCKEKQHIPASSLPTVQTCSLEGDTLNYFNCFF